MGEYEPDDSRDITRKPSDLPIEPERTGPRESETRTSANETEPATGPAEENMPLGSQNEREGKDLPRGSEPEARASSSHRS